MKNLIIVGASSWGLEVYAWHQDALGYGSDWSFKGFLDDNLNALDGVSFANHSILDRIDAYQIDKNDVFVCAIGNPKIKEKVVLRLQSKGVSFVSLIHKSVLFFRDVHLGSDIILSPSVIVSNSVVIGDHVAINLACTIGHNVKIGDFCQISSQCDLTGHVQLGKAVFMGSKSTIIPKVKVEDGAVIGAGSVVTRKVKTGTTVFGNPAKVIN